MNAPSINTRKTSVHKCCNDSKTTETNSMEQTILTTSALRGKAYLVHFPDLELTDVLYSWNTEYDFEQILEDRIGSIVQSKCWETFCTIVK